MLRITRKGSVEEDFVYKKVCCSNHDPGNYLVKRDLSYSLEPNAHMNFMHKSFSITLWII